MDTAKIANLFNTYRDAELIDFVNPSIGRGRQIDRELQTLICVPTTSGTGSEVTGIAVISFNDLKAKSAITSCSLMPTLALIDPLHSLTMPKNVATYTGFGVICRALESFTALPYYQTTPHFINPKARTIYQGSNPISDLWCIRTLKLVIYIIIIQQLYLCL